MKIAIFHNFLDNIGGAEVVDLILARELGADIYTTNIDEEKIQKMGFDTKRIFSIGNIPINPPFRHEAAYRKFKNLDLGDKYDIYIIAGDWAMSGAIHNKPNIWYIYSPVREIWDAYEYARDKFVPLYLRPLFYLWVQYHRRNNLNNLKHVGKFVAISENVKSRVSKFFDKEADIVYPPTDVSRYRYEKNGDFWLSVNRLFHHKRVDIQLKAFAKMPDEKLIIVGSYEKSKHFQNYAKYIKSIKPKNVEIISWIEFDRLINLFANCKGFITTSMGEDFGMTPVEAMASGKPVIAPNDGGYKETVINGQTGILIDDINEDKIVKAVKELGKNPEEYKNACLEQAQKFDVSIFVEKMKKIINDQVL